MYNPSNPAPLYPAIGSVGNLLARKSRSGPAFNLCVLPRAPPIKKFSVEPIFPAPKIKAPAWRYTPPDGLGENHG